MADILIRGVDIPPPGKHHLTLCVTEGGTAMVINNDFNYGVPYYEAIIIPPHGDLVDKNDMCKQSSEIKTNRGTYLRAVHLFDVYNAPVIIPASE